MKKHETTCAKAAAKQRKTFDVRKHRIQAMGSEAASFAQAAQREERKYEKKLEARKARCPRKGWARCTGCTGWSRPDSRLWFGQGNWRTKHEAFVAAIRAAKGDGPPAPAVEDPTFLKVRSRGAGRAGGRASRSALRLSPWSPRKTPPSVVGCVFACVCDGACATAVPVLREKFQRGRCGTAPALLRAQAQGATSQGQAPLTHSAQLTFDPSKRAETGQERSRGGEKYEAATQEGEGGGRERAGVASKTAGGKKRKNGTGQRAALAQNTPGSSGSSSSKDARTVHGPISSSAGDACARQVV